MDIVEEMLKLSSEKAGKEVVVLLLQALHSDIVWGMRTCEPGEDEITSLMTRNIMIRSVDQTMGTIFEDIGSLDKFEPEHNSDEFQQAKNAGDYDDEFKCPQCGADR